MTGPPRPRTARPAAAAALALAAALLLPACAAPLARARLRADLRDLRAASSRPAPSPLGTDSPGIVHCHTRLSHDSPGPLQEVVDAARAAGLRWVCLTEHTNPDAARALPRGEVDGVLLVPGEEISRWGGSVLALGIARHLDPARAGGGVKDYRELAAEIRAAGGVPLWGHATHFDRPPRWSPGAAVYDLSDDWRRVSPWRLLPAVRLLSGGDPGDAAEAYLLFVQRRPDAHLALWDGWLAQGPCPAVAETNAHAKFRYLGRTFDPYAGLFPLVRNHALVEGPGEEDLLRALAAGRTLIGFDALADSSGSRFEAWRGGAVAAGPGDSLVEEPGLSLAVHLPLPARVRILRDGKPWFSGEGRVLYAPVPGPGVYRMEADLDAAGRARPWVLSNAIRVLPRAPQ